MHVVDPTFRAVLVTRMLESGQSQRQVAAQAHVSPSLLSQLVNGTRNPSLSTAQALDDALAAAGDLAALVCTAATPDDRDDLAAAVIAPRRAGAAAVPALARVLAAHRAMDDTLGSAALLKPTTAHLSSVATLVREVTGPDRVDVMTVAAQWAQFLGWLHTSAGRWSEARQWLATAAEWAAELPDADLATTVTSFQAHLAWLMCQWPPAIGLAEAAARAGAAAGIYPGQRTYDLYAAARGHAAYGELADADRLLGEADQSAAALESWTGTIPVWHYYRSPWQWSAERGMVLLYAARSDPSRAAGAVDALAAGVAGIPVDQAGADWAAEYMTHLAAAHLCADQLDQAAAVLDQARTIAEQTSSGRVLRLVRQREARMAVMRQ